MHIPPVFPATHLLELDWHHLEAWSQAFHPRHQLLPQLLNHSLIIDGAVGHGLGGLLIRLNLHTLHTPHNERAVTPLVQSDCSDA